MSIVPVPRDRTIPSTASVCLSSVSSGSDGPSPRMATGEGQIRVGSNPLGGCKTFWERFKSSRNLPPRSVRLGLLHIVDPHSCGSLPVSDRVSPDGPRVRFSTFLIRPLTTRQRKKAPGRSTWKMENGVRPSTLCGMRRSKRPDQSCPS